MYACTNIRWKGLFFLYLSSQFLPVQIECTYMFVNSNSTYNYFVSCYTRAHKNGKPIVWSKLLKHAKNRTPGHVLSNKGLCLCAAAQYMLLFLVVAVNSNQFQIVRSYMLLLPVLMSSCCKLWKPLATS